MLEPEITAEVFALQRHSPDAPLLLDVREPWEAALASLPSSVLMPMGDVPSRAHQELDPDQKIVVICHHGARSMQVAAFLERQGFANVTNLTGGIHAWAKQVDTEMPTY